MDKILQSKTLFLIFTITLLGGILRWHNYAQFPSQNDTHDERAWSWLGASLINEGVPTSWSHFKSYTETNIFRLYEGGTTLVRPSLDHPPLFSFIPGVFHIATSESIYEIPSQKAIRFPMVLIGTLNVLLFSVIAFRIAKFPAATLGSLFFASSPLVVASSRVVVADNVLATVVLLILLLATQKKQNIVHFSLLAGLAILFKVQGAFIGAGLLLFFFDQKKYKHTLSISIGMIVAVLIFMLYGAYFDWQLFKSVLSEQSSRMIGLTTLIHRFFFHPTLANKQWITGIKSILTISTIFIAIYNYKKTFWKLIISLLVAYFVVSVATYDETNINGWYEYAISPLLFIGAIPIFEYMLNKANKALAWIVWLFVSLPLIKVIAVNMGNLNPFSHTVKKIFPLVGGVVYAPIPKSYIKKIIWVFLITLIALQVVAAWTLSTQSYNHQLFLLNNF